MGSCGTRSTYSKRQMFSLQAESTAVVVFRTVYKLWRTSTCPCAVSASATSSAASAVATRIASASINNALHSSGGLVHNIETNDHCLAVSLQTGACAWTGSNGRPLSGARRPSISSSFNIRTSRRLAARICLCLWVKMDSNTGRAYRSAAAAERPVQLILVQRMLVVQHLAYWIAIHNSFQVHHRTGIVSLKKNVSSVTAICFTSLASFDVSDEWRSLDIDSIKTFVRTFSYFVVYRADYRTRHSLDRHRYITDTLCRPTRTCAKRCSQCPAECLEILGLLDALQTRRIKSDLVLCYGMAAQLHESAYFFVLHSSISTSITRGHNCNMFKPECSLDVQSIVLHTGLSISGTACQVILLMLVAFLFLNTN